MSISCVDCSSCGKCYPKDSTCSQCGGVISLLDDRCPECKEPITDAMREAARQAYMQKKRDERDALFPGLKKNREKRSQWLKGL